MAASGIMAGAVIKSLVDSFLDPAGPTLRDVSLLPPQDRGGGGSPAQTALTITNLPQTPIDDHAGSSESVRLVSSAFASMSGQESGKTPSDEDLDSYFACDGHDQASGVASAPRGFENNDSNGDSAAGATGGDTRGMFDNAASPGSGENMLDRQPSGRWRRTEFDAHTGR
jgi:hypothetical protein